MNTISLWTFTLTAIISSILVISCKTPIMSIISLIVTFLSSIGALILLNQEFLGLIYCIVYVGAIAILFIFVIMLLSNNGANTKLNIYDTYYLAIISSVFILTIWSTLSKNNFNGLQISNQNIVALIKHNNNISNLGNLMYTICDYEILLVISYILLVALIGSIYLTKIKNVK